MQHYYIYAIYNNFSKKA